MSGQEHPPTSSALPPPHTAALCTASPSLLAAPQVLNQSSPHHAASAGQARASKGQARCHGSSSERDSTNSSGGRGCGEDGGQVNMITEWIAPIRGPDMLYCSSNHERPLN
eukprot:1158849-Pelagomonas_calceolata.AAC.2